AWTLSSPWRSTVGLPRLSRSRGPGKSPHHTPWQPAGVPSLLVVVPGLIEAEDLPEVDELPQMVGPMPDLPPHHTAKADVVARPPRDVLVQLAGGGNRLLHLVIVGPQGRQRFRLGRGLRRFRAVGQVPEDVQGSLGVGRGAPGQLLLGQI